MPILPHSSKISFVTPRGRIQTGMSTQKNIPKNIQKSIYIAIIGYKNSITYKNLHSKVLSWLDLIIHI